MAAFGFSLSLHERASDVPFVSLTRHIKNGGWSRTTRAMGGYWGGQAEISNATMSRLEMQRVYNGAIGKTIRECTYGIVTWEGEIVTAELELDGIMHRRTMDPEHFHNKVKVEYRHPVDEDSNQGVMAYNPAGSSFQDTLQDFGDWETVAGTPVYLITVYNNDGSFCYGYCLDAFATANPDDSINVATNLDRDGGWNGDTGGKVPSSYVISNVEERGSSQETDWTADADAAMSIDQYGYCEYIAVFGELTDESAEAMRDRRLERHKWPSSMTVDGMSTGAQQRDTCSLRLICSGYTLSMNRRIYETDLWATNISDQITTLVGTSDWVSAGKIDTNTTLASVRGTEIPIRTWDAIEELIEQGDTSGNDWVGGVYAGRTFDYHQAATTVSYTWHGGKATNLHGVPMVPTLILPDRIIHVADVPLGVVPPGGGQWHNPHNEYISMVEFVSPREYRITTGHGLTLTSGI